MRRNNMILKSVLLMPVLCGTLLFAEEEKNERVINNNSQTTEAEIVKNLELLENLEILREMDFFKYLPFLELHEGEEEL